MTIAYILLAVYLVIAFIFNVGMLNEYKKDKTGELNEFGFSDTFIKICLFAGSLIWPVLVITEIIKSVKENKE